MTEPLSSLLTETGRQLALRFTNSLAVPGVLFVATAATAVELAHRHSLDVSRLVGAVLRVTNRFDHRPVPAVLALLAAGLAAGAAGVICGSVSTMLASLWLLDRPRWLAHRLTRRRVRRWQSANTAYRDAVASSARAAGAENNAPPDEPARRRLAELAAFRNTIALMAPTRATWAGDRLAAAGLRVWAEYGLDVSFSWPRLWLVLPEFARDRTTEAGRAFAAARVVQGWGVLYLVLGVLWWPSAVAGAFALLLGWRRGRMAVATLADLIEANYDLYAIGLVAAIHGGPSTGSLDRLAGERLNVRLRKGA